MTDKVQKIRKEVEKRYEYWKEKESNSHSIESEIRMSECQHLLLMLDSLQEEPVSDDFTKALAECVHQAQGNVVDPMVFAELWKDELIKLAKSEEPVSEDLEEAAIQFATDTETGKVDVVKQGSFFWGAQWKEQQFEKNRLKHCDSITNEQAELEKGFIDQHLDKHQRMPTFLDAIEYGMRLQQEHMIEKACRGYCDDICEKGMAGMCFHKHDGKGQVKNTFKYNECNELQILINAMKDE